RELFDEFVLKQMETINTAVALSDTEKDLVTQRLGQVFEALGKELRATATLVVKLLDGKPKSPVKFQAQNKKPTTKDEKWLALSVWVNLISEAIQSQDPLKSVFKDDYRENPQKREKAAKVIWCYLKAIEGLIADRKYWHNTTAKQRLYHNVGLKVLLG